MSLEEECSWDPIDDIVKDDRSKYIDIIQIFLLLKDETVEDENVELTKPSLAKEKKTSKKKGAKVDEKKEPLEPNGLLTRLKIRKRLKEGDEYRHGPGPMLKGTIENPLDAGNRTVPLSDDEIDGVLDEITEIKHLFFCRLLLSHASLLPAAIRANNVEAFLADREINDADLRDICLKLENPDLQAMRDACADLLRGEEDDVEEPSETDEGESNILSEITKPPSKFPPWRRSNGLPQMWKPKRDHQLRKRRQRQQSIMDQSTGGSEGNFIDFSLMDDETEQRGKKMRVRVCGRSVYNYPSEKAMNRGGWLHFLIIAHESSLYDAVGLCRHWDEFEFYELNVLTVFRFFPNGSWLEWGGDQLKQRLLQLVCFTMICNFSAGSISFVGVHSIPRI